MARSYTIPNTFNRTTAIYQDVNENFQYFIDALNNDVTLLADGTTAATADKWAIRDASGKLSAIEFLGGLAAAAGDYIRSLNTNAVTLAGTTHPFQLGNTSGANLCMSNGEIQARNNGAATALKINEDGGNVNIGQAGGTANLKVNNNIVYHAGNVDENATASTVPIRDSSGNLKAASLVLTKAIKNSGRISRTVSSTKNNVFDDLNSCMPDTGSYYFCFGQCESKTIIYAYKANSTTLQLYAIDGSVVVVTDSDSTNLSSNCILAF